MPSRCFLEKACLPACQSRFTILVDKLSASGVKIPQWEQSLAIIYGMSDKYELTRRIALMSTDSKSLLVMDIFGNFFDQENADNQRSSVNKETRGTALKLTRVLEKIENEEDDDDDDLEIIPMTKW